MAPEYVLDEDQTTLKCDVYSFGVTLLETLSGRRNSMGLNSLIAYVSKLDCLYLVALTFSLVNVVSYNL
jgi:hypothetical protein